MFKDYPKSRKWDGEIEKNEKSVPRLPGLATAGEKKQEKLKAREIVIERVQGS